VIAGPTSPLGAEARPRVTGTLELQMTERVGAERKLVGMDKPRARNSDNGRRSDHGSYSR